MPLSEEKIIEETELFFVKKGSWRDMKYTNVVLKQPVRVVVCVDEDRFLLDGTLKLAKVENHPPWEDEFQIQFYCAKKKFKKELRADSEWNTVEICFPLNHGLDLLEKSVLKLCLDDIEKPMDPPVKDWKEIFKV